MGRRLSRIDHVCRGDSVVFPSAARSIPGASTPESENTCASSSYAHLTAAEAPEWVVRRRCLTAPEWHSKTKALCRMRQNAFEYVSHVIIRRSMWCMLSIVIECRVNEHKAYSSDSGNICIVSLESD